MKLRLASAILWFLAGCILVGGISVRLGFDGAVGPVVGVLWAAFVMVDPKDLIWRVRPRAQFSRQGLADQAS